MTTVDELLSSPPDEFHLGCLLLSPSSTVYLGQALEEVGAEDFADPTYGWMWAASKMLHTSGARITQRALLALRDQVAPYRGPGSEPGPVVPSGVDVSLALTAPAAPALRARMAAVEGHPVFPDRLPRSVRAVQQAARLRRLVETLDRAKHHAVAAEDYSEALGRAHELLAALDEAEVPPEVLRFSDLVDDFRKWQAGGLDLGGVIGTPWTELSAKLSGGFRPGQVVVVGGRLGEGKSIIGLQCAQCAAELAVPSVVVSQEMPSLELAGRLFAAGARVEYGEITRAEMGPESWEATEAYAEQHRDMPLWVLDRPGMTIESVMAVCRTMIRRDGVRLVVIDYAQLLDPSNGRVSREQQVAHIARASKVFARAERVTVMLLAQLNKDNVKGNRRPMMTDLRESDALGQCADIGLLIHHETTEDDQPTGEVVLIVAKQRGGPKGEVTLRFRGHQVRIGD